MSLINLISNLFAIDSLQFWWYLTRAAGLMGISCSGSPPPGDSSSAAKFWTRSWIVALSTIFMRFLPAWVGFYRCACDRADG